MSSPRARGRDDSSLRAYLDVLAAHAPADSFLELRYRVGEQALAASFFEVAHADSLVREIHARSGTTDVYVGCVPRIRRSGTKDALGASSVLWAECDGANAARAALEFTPRPSVVVASGSGPNLHAYWPLTEELSGRLVEEANLRLVAALGADPQCFDAGRILRPPGTWNHKRRPPRPVALERFEPARRFHLDEVLARTPIVATSHIEHRWEPRAPRQGGADPLLAIPPRTYVARLLGKSPGRDHKVPCPLHDDERPSLHVYATAERGWCCYSCGRGGSIYDLAAAVWGLGTRGADFKLVRERLVGLFDVDRAVMRERTLR